MGYASGFSDFRFLFENFSLIRMNINNNVNNVRWMASQKGEQVVVIDNYIFSKSGKKQEKSEHMLLELRFFQDYWLHC
jgi:hypothetical protein